MPIGRVWCESPALIGRPHETQRLHRLIEGLGAGRGGALLILGEAGMGKTALLESVRVPPRTAVLRTCGREIDRPRDHDGLYELCAPLLATVTKLSSPQRKALEAAFDPATGRDPDPFLVGAATVGLLAEASAELPVLCVVDDAHWLDGASVRALAFAARRAPDARVAFLIATRQPNDRAEWASLPSLLLTGLPEDDTRGVPSKRVGAPLDRGVRERVIAEGWGNPLALRELVCTAGLPDPETRSGAASPGTPMEDGFRRRIDALPADTRQLLLVAAAEPAGHPLCLWRALRHLDIDVEAAVPAEEAGLLSVDLWIRFSHPLVRSIVWFDATPADRRTVHRALAVVAMAHEPDRWIWHHSQSLAGPDEAAAKALERSAAREHLPGRAAAFLEAAARLTPDVRDRAARTLRAAGTQRDAGAHDAAERLLTLLRSGPLDERLTAGVETLRARMALDRGRCGVAAGLLGRAAALMASVDGDLAREVRVDELAAAACAGRFATGSRPPAPPEATGRTPLPDFVRPLDLLLDGLVERVRGGVTAAAPALGRALRAYLDGRDAHPYGPGEAWAVCSAAIDLWDDSAWRRLADRQVRDVRRAGALTGLPAALGRRALVHVHAGELEAAAALVREIDSLPGDTGRWGVPCVRTVLAAWRGERAQVVGPASRARRDAVSRGEGHLLTAVEYAGAVLFNGLGRPADTVRMWRSVHQLEETGLHTWGLVELVEAAVKSGTPDLAEVALDEVLRRTETSSTNWALGVRLCSRALLSCGSDAGDLYQEAIRRLDLSDAILHAARARLLHGEWLRAGGHRMAARRQLRQANSIFSACGATAFAARAARELHGAGEHVNTPRSGPVDASCLTTQELRIARLVATGATSREVGDELYLSNRTVEAHLRSIFKKMGISSRRQLHGMLPLR
ncbi:AAA family ATPase [Streptomyces sp. NPDC020965]|uniref:helix-turn-helix transcriptional regulator n=1 Tax=Streptomyces sp. NPDC020965 TaxID=3365105 RepID=UPI0037ACFF09